MEKNINLLKLLWRVLSETVPLKFWKIYLEISYIYYPEGFFFEHNQLVELHFYFFFQLLTYRIFYFWRWCMEISCFFFYQYSVWVCLGSIKAFFEMNSKIWQYMCHLLRTNINTQDFVSFDLFFCELELCFLYFLSCHWR